MMLVQQHAFEGQRLAEPAGGHHGQGRLRSLGLGLALSVLMCVVCYAAELSVTIPMRVWSGGMQGPAYKSIFGRMHLHTRGQDLEAK